MNEDGGKQKVRCASKLKTLAEALLLQPGKKQQAMLREWSRWPDFPKKLRHGWPIDAVRDWLAANAEKIARQKALARVVDVDARESRQDMEAIRSGELPAPAAGGDLPKYAEGLAAIAAILSREFGQRVSIQIKRQEVHEWRKGNRLPNGVPPFPGPKESNRFDVAQCLAWFEKYLLPEFSNEAKSPLLPGFSPHALAQEQMRSEFERLEHERYLRGVEQKQYIPVAEADRDLAGALKAIFNVFRLAFEREGPAQRREALRSILLEGKLTPDQMLTQFHLLDLAASQKAFDEVARQCADLGRDGDTGTSNTEPRGAGLADRHPTPNIEAGGEKAGTTNGS